MSEGDAPVADLYLVVGYDGSPPGNRALDVAVNLLHGRTGRIEVVYIAHLPGIDMLSADAVGQMEIDFDGYLHRNGRLAGNLVGDVAEFR